jgi:hypothetical protein
MNRDIFQREMWLKVVLRDTSVVGNPVEFLVTDTNEAVTATSQIKLGPYYLPTCVIHACRPVLKYNSVSLRL